MAVKKPTPGYLKQYIDPQLPNVSVPVSANNALTMVANVSGATANLEIQDSSTSLSQAEYRVFAKTVVTELNAIRTALINAGIMES